MTSPGKPNVVFIRVDNCGWGDFGCYGGTVPTPRIDSLAADGLRLNNYTVEAQCTPTRSAILTGRLPVRSGTTKVPMPGQGESGLAPWEYTLAELFSDAGYATAAFGKWHLGEAAGRLEVEACVVVFDGVLAAGRARLCAGAGLGLLPGGVMALAVVGLLGVFGDEAGDAFG
jgi:arylsulfatase